MQNILKAYHALDSGDDQDERAQVRLVDAGGGHRISALIADDGVCLTIHWVSDDDEPVKMHFFTTESLLALRNVCDSMLSRGPLIEDNRAAE